MLKDVVVTAMLTAALLAAGQGQEKQPAWALKFEDYAVNEVFKGKPKPLILTSVADSKLRNYTSAIGEAAHKGPNFAGHYTVAEWGCGAGCISFVIVDAATGRLSRGPAFSVSLPPPTGKSRNYQGLVYQRQSRLLIVDGCPNEGNRGCGTYYYEFNSGVSKLVRSDFIIDFAKPH